MMKHWTEALDEALTTTYIVSVQHGVDFDEARKLILSWKRDYEDFDELCWYICFGSTVKVPGKPTLREVLEPELIKMGLFWEEFEKQHKIC